MNKLFQYLRTTQFRKNLIAAIVSILALVLVAFFVLRMYTRHGEEYDVPELKGMHIDQATSILDDLGFSYQLDSVYQLDATPGMVIDQDPAPKVKVKENRTLYLTIITRTAPEVGFPELIDKTFIEARALIASYGLKLGDTTYTADIARDVVLNATFGGQKINSGRNIPKGSKIDLVLGDGRGDNEVAIPELKGLTLMEATFALNGISLGVGNVRYLGTITDSTSAVIIEQSPSTESGLISIGSKIDITLSNRP
jgi:beta-lactam-binding protein with PASTA domain